MKLAFIGLGVMGYPMAGHLARNGCGGLDSSSLMRLLSEK